MTQEEKAKRYDEVLNKLRHFIAQGVNPLITIADAQDFFPELAESEDERIRKEIISAIKEDWPGHTDWIAWLEKQCQDGKVWFYRDDYVRDKKQAYQDGIDKVLNNPQKYGFEKQGEQKPAWSEEDDVKINRIVACLENLNVADNDILLKDVDWLKSLIVRIQPQSKQEWSEEDETIINNLVWAISNDCIRPQDREDYCDWLKSLRPQNRWKPSDEQLHYLSWIANIKLGDSVVEQEVSKHLNELLEDLKKLREE